MLKGNNTLAWLIASSARQRIIIALQKEPTHSLIISKLQFQTGSLYNELHRNVGILSKENIIHDVKTPNGRRADSRVISLNTSEPNTQKLLAALKILDVPLNNNNKTEEKIQ